MNIRISPTDKSWMVEWSGSLIFDHFNGTMRSYLFEDHSDMSRCWSLDRRVTHVPCRAF